MEENVDFSTQKTINDLIQRAKEERERALNTIEFLLIHKVPRVFKSVQETIDNLAKIAERLEVKFEPNIEEYNNLEKTCIQTLEQLKEQLENASVEETELLYSDVIGKSYGMLETISTKLDEIPGNIWDKNRQAIFDGISQKEEENRIQEETKKQEQEELNELKKQKVESEKEEMYLKGMLDVVIMPKKKKELEQKILKTEDKIKNINEQINNRSLVNTKKEVIENDDEKDEEKNIKPSNQELSAETKEDEVIEF